MRIPVLPMTIMQLTQKKSFSFLKALVSTYKIRVVILIS